MLKLIDATKAKLYGLPAEDIADETKYNKDKIDNAIEAGAFKRTDDAPKNLKAPVKSAVEE